MSKPPQCVQEIVMNNGPEIPERYLNNVQNVDVTSSIPLMDTSSIDMGLLASRSTQELAKLRSILTSWGCFQLVNHGISIELMDQVRRVTKEFFGLPKEEKQKYARTADGVEGYGTDNVYDHHTINWNDRLRLTLFPDHKRLLHLWPLTLPNFREVVDEFTEKSHGVMKTLLTAMAAALNLEDTIFLEQFGEEGTMVGRISYYPPCPRPEAVLGLKPHSDGTAITLLLQDSEVEALEVLNDDKWFRVSALPHALFINTGDQMEIMSNGLFKSAIHRVTTNRERERVSLAMFCLPDNENEIGPASELVTEERPQMYNTTKNYTQIYFKIDPTDVKRPIDLLRI